MRSINLQMDGNQVCATWDDFIDLHDSPAGFGDTLWSAIGKLIDNTPAKQINGIVSSIENAPQNAKELAATVRPEAGPANNARAEICAVIVEGDSPCTYCAHDLDTSCNSDLCDSRFSGFKGRKLSPV